MGLRNSPERGSEAPTDAAIGPRSEEAVEQWQSIDHDYIGRRVKTKILSK